MISTVCHITCGLDTMLNFMCLTCILNSVTVKTCSPLHLRLYRGLKALQHERTTSQSVKLCTRCAAAEGSNTHNGGSTNTLSPKRCKDNFFSEGLRGNEA